MADQDFSSFVTEPALAFDFTLSNGKHTVQCHKNVLIKISTVLKSALEGDSEADTIVMKTISTDVLNFLVEYLYTKPHERYYLKLNLRLWLSDLLTLSSKWGIDGIVELMESNMRNQGYYRRGDKYKKAIDDATRKGFPHIKRQIQECTITNSRKLTYKNLKTFSEETVVSMVHMNSEVPSFLAKAIAYGIENDAEEVFQAVLHSVEVPENEAASSEALKIFLKHFKKGMDRCVYCNSYNPSIKLCENCMAVSYCSDLECHRRHKPFCIKESSRVYINLNESRNLMVELEDLL